MEKPESLQSSFLGALKAALLCAVPIVTACIGFKEAGIPGLLGGAGIGVGLDALVLGLQLRSQERKRDNHADLSD